MSNCVVVLNDLETYTGLDGCQLVELRATRKQSSPRWTTGTISPPWTTTKKAEISSAWTLKGSSPAIFETAKMSNQELAAQQSAV